MDNNDKLIQEQLKSVPPEVKAAIDAVPWQNRLRTISQREGFDHEKSQTLEMETMFIIYGFLPANEYGANINRELGLDDETTGRVVKQVSDEIFADIEKQYEMLEDKNKTPIQTVTPTPPPKPKVFEVNTNLPEVLPNQPAHEVPHIETSPAVVAPTLKPQLVPTPSYAPTQSAPTTDTLKRPELNLPKSDYNHGQDPYHEPLQ